MEPLIVLAITFVLLWVIFILPQQRRVRAHQALVASVQPGDEVILSAGIYGRIVDLGPEDMTLQVAPGVEIRVARQAVLRLITDATGADAGDDAVGSDEGSDTAADAGADAPATSDPDHPGPAAPGANE